MTNSLLPRIAAGDPRALGECIRQHHRAVWAITRRFCRCSMEAEDALQEIWLDLWKSAHRYDPSQLGELSFIRMIARRRLIDRLRRKGRRPATTALNDGYEPQPTRSEPIEAHAEATLAARALASLRPVQRDVLLMSAYQGMSHREIADSTGLPLGTVKAHARRGMNRVRELLAA